MLLLQKFKSDLVTMKATQYWFCLEVLFEKVLLCNGTKLVLVSD